MTARQLVFDYRQAELPADDRELCDYAIKLTRAPGKMSERDIAPLREHGFSDDQITIATQVIGYFNYINRIADALGVPHEDFVREWERPRL